MQHQNLIKRSCYAATALCVVGAVVLAVFGHFNKPHWGYAVGSVSTLALSVVIIKCQKLYAAKRAVHDTNQLYRQDSEEFELDSLSDRGTDDTP